MPLFVRIPRCCLTSGWGVLNPDEIRDYFKSSPDIRTISSKPLEGCRWIPGGAGLQLQPAMTESDILRPG